MERNSLKENNRIFSQIVFLTCFILLFVFFAFVLDPHYGGPIMVFVLGLFLIIGGFYLPRNWFAVDSILYRIARQPLQKIETITVDNPTAFFGTIECEKPLISPYTKTPCVFYHSFKQVIDEGLRQTGMIGDNIADFVEFYVNDGTGRIGISLKNVNSQLQNFKVADSEQVNYKLPDYAKSEIDAKAKFFYETSKEQMRDQYGSFKPITSLVREFLLEPGQKFFVYGWVHEENGKKIVSEAKDYPLIISRKKKSAYLKDFSFGGSFFSFPNSLLLIGGYCLSVLLLISSTIFYQQFSS